jgi:chorismate mutase
MWQAYRAMASANGEIALVQIARNRHRCGMDEQNQLTRYRDSIDNIDAALVFMLAERFKITQAVGEFKATNALPPSDPGREEKQIERLRQLARDAKLDPDFTEKFLRFIINEVIRHHHQIRDDSQ